MNVLSPPAPSNGTDDVRRLEQNLTFDNLLSRIWRRRGHFALGFAIPLAVAVAVVLVARPVFVATGSVMVGEQESSSSSASPAWIQKLGDPADMESQLLILKSSRMLRLVLARPGVIEAVRRECRLGGSVSASIGSATDCDIVPVDGTVFLRHIERRYSAHAIGRSRIISIGYESRLPDVAFVMANALLISYLEDQRAQNARIRALAAGWILKEGDRVEKAGADKSAEQFYVDLHKNFSDLETERRAYLNGGRLVSLAEVPQLPYFPKLAPILAAGLTLGAILGSLAALFKDMTDTSVRRIADLTHTGLPVLVRLPLLASRQRSLVRTLHLAARERDFNEHMPVLFAQVALRAAGTQQRVLITSAVIGEGKSLTTLALARFAANAGRRVLVIDCNLRRPAVADALQLDTNCGLADVLQGRCSIADAIQSTSIEGLDAIAAGSFDGDPAMLLIEGQPLRRLDEIDGYDLILFDGPPLGHFVDGHIFAGHAGSVLWCVRWGATPVGQVTAALCSLADMQLKVTGFVLTMTEPRVRRRFARKTAPVLTTRAIST